MSETNLESTVEAKSILDVLNEDIGPFPSYLINLFGFLGYNTYETLKDFSLQDANDIERFAREDLSRLIPDTADERKKYFGPYYSFPKIFRILPGHKKLILSIPAYMKGAHEDNVNREHFCRRLNHQKNLKPTSFRSIDSLSAEIEELEESTIQNAYDGVGEDDEDEEDHISEEQNDSSLVRVNSSHYDGAVGDAKRIRLGENSIKTQNDEHRIRDTINRWLLNVKHKLKSGTNISVPLCYSIVFYHRPEEGKMSATIECCMCQIQIGISSHRNKNGSRRWLISNFMRHVKKNHYAECNVVEKNGQWVQQHQKQSQQQQQQLINIVDISTLVKRELE